MPIKRREIQALIFLVPILALLFLDQYSKAKVSLNLDVGESIPLIRGILHITYIRNTGAAFGLFKDAAFVFILISIIAVCFLSVLIIKAILSKGFSIRPVFNTGLILIFSGALGNLIDRFRFGYVIDFIDVRIWPVFNIADASITIGTTFLITALMQKRHPI